MTITQLLKKRKSIRKYKNKKVSKKIINELLESARLAPSSRNRQPWKFKIIQDKKTKQFLKEKKIYLQNFVYDAPVIIVCCTDSKLYPRKDYSLIDLSIACQNLVLRATELGLGTCYIGLMQENKIKKLLNIPKNYNIPYSIIVGYPNEKGKSTKRKSMKEMII